jgi:hypothetical protein
MIQTNNKVTAVHILYKELFTYYETELKTIFTYVSPTNENLKTHSHKITEMHQGVCIAIENMLKHFTHTHIKSEVDIKTSLKKDKFAGFLLCFNLMKEKTNLDKKMLLFTASYDAGEDFELYYLQPFETKNNVPEWWTAYNKSKHNKIDDFKTVTLGSLVNSVGAMYILLNYTNHYWKDNPAVFSEEIITFTKYGSKSNYDTIIEKSNFYKVPVFDTFSSHHKGLPERVNETEYLKLKEQYGGFDNPQLVENHFQDDASEKFKMFSSYEGSLIFTFVDYIGTSAGYEKAIKYRFTN